MSPRNKFVCLFVCFALGIAVTAEAANATLTWNRNPEPDVTGYRLSIGFGPGVYEQVIDVGNVLTWTLKQVHPTRTYYFAVQAYDSRGQLSGYSTEVIRTPAGPGLMSTAALATDVRVTTDLWWQHEDGRLAVWRMDGATPASDGPVNPDRPADPDWRVVAAGDFNNDRKTDVVWKHRVQGRVVVWLMDGADHINSVVVGTEPDPNWNIVAAGDLDGNLQLDLIWQHTSGNLAVWFMDGTSLTSATPLEPRNVAPDTWTIVGAADFDLDGTGDILWQHANGSLSAWFMNGAIKRDAQYLTPAAVDPAWHVVAVADYNQDGRADIVFRKEDGALAAWYLSGITMIGTAPIPSRVEPDWKIVGPK